MVTSKTGLTTPDLGASPNVPADMSSLATQLDNTIVPVFASSTARDAAITAGATFRLCQVSGVVQQRIGSVWSDLNVNTVGSTRALPNCGTYDANKPVRFFVGFASTLSTNATALVSLATPAGTTAVMAAMVLPMMNAQVMTQLTVLRYDLSSVASIAWQFRALDTGALVANTAVQFNYFIAHQI